LVKNGFGFAFKVFDFSSLSFSAASDFYLKSINPVSSSILVFDASAAAAFFLAASISNYLPNYFTFS
jgi:hypothetical protein